jgi:UDP-N-acetylmuramyl pentapeptide phosphotransferase/UDP-N-acetylglucosamine-1-phosphate transferase
MIYILFFILLFAVELIYFRIADHFDIIDKPNERSSHKQITLRGGGIIVYISVLLYSFVSGFQYPWFLVGITLISIVSMADDIRPQSPKLRVLIHFISMALMFYQWGLFSMPWYLSIVAFIVSIGILNAYNFMDGINGITGGYSLIIALALLYINNQEVSFVDNKLIYAFILSLLVFNFFNFRTKAKCFAGDVGAISIAFLLVFLIGRLIIETNDFSYIILFAVYGVDSVLTIIHRLILKENIFQPHRKHAYQILANELKIPHLTVAIFYALIQGLIMLGFFFFKSHSYIYLSSVIAILSMAYVGFKLKYYHLHKI